MLIISATNRKNSYSLRVSKIVESFYQELNEPCELMDLKTIPFHEMIDNPYTKPLSPGMQKAADKVAEASSMVIVCPEYNGSFPGIFKFFIDHWHFPQSFEYKPLCFIGLGGRFGALRPVEQLESLFTYRKSFVFSEKVFISQVQEVIQEDGIQDDTVTNLLKRQAKNFIKFTKALQSKKFG